MANVVTCEQIGAMSELTPAETAKFWSKVFKREPSECWLWMGAQSSNGYAVFEFGGRNMSVPRIVWMLTFGQVPEDFIRHHCDNKSCCNAAVALQQMGTNAIPALLARLAYKEPVFGLYDSDVSMEAVAGLISMREQARPALPTLTTLMDSDDQGLALRAMIATLGTGADAIPCLMKGLTNRFPDVRNEAASSLTGDWGARFPEQRQQVVPFLVKLLNDPDQYVRMNATNQLKELDPQAAARAGIK